MSARADHVRLEIPASPEYVLLARLTAAGLAARSGTGLEDIDDLRVLVAETCRLLMGESGTEGTITLTYAVVGDKLSVEGQIDRAPSEEIPEDDLSLHLIAALADEHAVSSDGSGRFVRTVKRLALR